MTGVREANSPRDPLYRISRLPNPLGWPPLSAVGGGRFDDLRRRFRTLYCAEQRRACFYEVLGPLRPDPETLLRVKHLGTSPDPAPIATVPRDWCSKRAIGRLRPASGQKWLDLRAIETREALRVELAETLVRLGLADLDGSTVRSPHRVFTQTVAAWAWDNGYHGVVYSSRFDDECTCWALFSNGSIEQVGSIELILPDDVDFRHTLELFGLHLQR